MIGGVFGMAAVHSLANSEATSKSARAMSKVQTLQMQNRMLQTNIAKVLMITEALWEIVRDDRGLSDEVLNKKIYEIDMRDGMLDGQNQRPSVKCPDCGHMVSVRHAACLYCGKVIDKSIFSVS